jgi:5-formyltetrahydrofolate cyclo-ligase
MTPEERSAESRANVRAILGSKILEGVEVVALYAAIRHEADPSALEPWLWRRGISTVYPRIEDRALAFHEGKLESLSPSPPWNIPEPPLDAPKPKRIDLFIVPGLGFTARGDRIGYGKGYYDRVLAERGAAKAVGFAFACQVVGELPVGPDDVRLDAIVAGGRLTDLAGAPGSP